MFGQSLLSAFGIACTTDTDQLFTTPTSTTSLATYQLNNATTSIPSNTYPGTASNITYAAGKFGNAAVFNGSSSRINLGSSNKFQGNEISFSLWVNYNTVNGNPILSNYNGGGYVAGDFYINYNSTGFMVQCWDGSGFQYRANISISANTWYHVVYTKTNDTTGGKFYVNGSEISGSITSGTSSGGTIFGTGDNFYLGNHLTNTDALNGKLDQVRIFNTALPQAAVTALYNETTTTAQSASIDYQLANPNSVAYYKMSDATDQLGNYNGTATNVNFNTVGKFGFAGAFNGSNINTNLSLNNLTDYTISLWLEPTGGAFFGGTIDSSAKNGFYFQYSSNILYWVEVNASSTVSNLQITGEINDGSWNHIVFVRNSGTNYVYVNNGTPTSVSNGSYTHARNFILGRAGDFTISPIIGKIDQVRIYDSALSAANVTALYNEIECPAVAVTNAFNTVLYTGNGGTQSITSVGFQPDFVWIKSRNASASHVLSDSVRGANLKLRSNSTAAEAGTDYGVVTSFDSNGFSVGGTIDTGDANYLNRTYVAWNWKAPLANLSTSFNGSSSNITAANILDTSSAFTYSLWINPTTISTLDFLIGHQQAASPYAGVSLLSSGSNKLFLSISGASSQDMTPTLTLNSWSHIVLTHDGSGNYTCYTNDNGSPITYSGATSNNSSNPFRIGFSSVSGWGYFDGKIGQVRIFDNALSSSEVTTLYEEPAASNNTLNYPAGAGCIAAYPLQTDAVDLSGNYSGASSNVTFGQPGYLTGDTNGTIPSTVATNVDAGFSIVKYTGSGANATVGHGLSSAPELMFIKSLDGSLNWVAAQTTLGVARHLNTTDPLLTSSYNAYFSSNPTTSLINLASNSTVNTLNYDYIAYCFTSIPGYSKVGSYVGTGATGNVQYVGFEPAFLMVKRSNSTGNWCIVDNKRNPTNERNKFLFANESVAEGNLSAFDTIDFTSNGFILQDAGALSGSTNININGSTYIFIAIA